MHERAHEPGSYPPPAKTHLSENTKMQRIASFLTGGRLMSATKPRSAAVMAAGAEQQTLPGAEWTGPVARDDVPHLEKGRTAHGGQAAGYLASSAGAGSAGPAAQGSSLMASLPGMLPRLWRFALRLAGNQDDAQDLVQRACVRALERQHQLQPGTSALSWMFSIIHSVWLNEVRARRIRSRASLQWNDELADELVDCSNVDPETDALHHQVIAAVDGLPDAQRAVMLLVAVEGLTYKESAAALGIPIGTLMSRLARARLTIGQAFGAAR